MHNIVFKIQKDINCILIIDKTVYFGSSDKNVYEQRSKDTFLPIITHDAQVTALADLKGTIISAGLDGKVRFHDGYAFESQMPVVRCMSTTPDGDYIALGGPDGMISVHYSDGRLERHWEGHCEGTVYVVLWWNKVLFSSSSNSDIKCWNLEKLKSKALMSKNNVHDASLSGCGVYAMAIHKQKLACAGGDNKVSLWEFRDNDEYSRFELTKIKILSNHSAPVNDIKYSKDGTLLATCSIDKSICIWNAEGQLIRQNQSHSAAVLTIAWTDNGIFSGGSDHLLVFTFFNTANMEEPADLCCPISTNLMFDCVTAEDGQSYSRKAIEDWFRKGGKMSPLTGAVIGTKLLENIDVQQKVQQFISTSNHN